jgi:lipoprotein-anchoring transpeptidase ErfK/SrfK
LTDPPYFQGFSVRPRTAIAIAALLVLAVLAGAVIAYDHSRRDLIAEGVMVGGVDVGGLREDQARAKLQRELLTPLDRPIVVRAAGRRFQLTPIQARIHADIAGMAYSAVARSRRGSIFSRVARGLTGAHVYATLPAQIDYSRDAVARLVKHVKRAVNQAPREADVSFSGSGVTIRQGHIGRAIDPQGLARDIEARILRPGSGSLVAGVRKVQPTVTTRDLARKYPWIVVVNRGAFRLTVFRDLKPQKTYRIAVGQVGLETPAGLYHVQNKAINPAWHVPNSAWAGKLAGKVIPGGAPDNPLKARWLGIFDGAGIHGTDALYSLGTAASHGCIRMAIPDVEEVYDEVPLGAPVYIA